MTCTDLYIEAIRARSQGLPMFVVQVRRKRYRSRRIRIARSLPAQIIGGNSVGYFVSVKVTDALRFCYARAPETLIPARLQHPLEKIAPDLRAQCNMGEPPANPWEGVPE